MNKIMLVDDHAMFRDGIKVLIEDEGIGTVIAEAENGQKFLQLLQDYEPDLIIMDLEMPVMGGLEAIKRALSINPQLKILVLTMLNDDINYTEIVHAGVMGLILKTSGKKELERAFDAILNGESYFSAGILRHIITKSTSETEKQTKSTIKFTERETEVLQWLCKGLTVSEIGEKIFLSVKTIETHRSSLLRKTDAKNTINLILFAIKNKLVEI